MASLPHSSEKQPTARPTVVSVGFDVLDRIEQAVAMVKERMRRAVAAWVARVDPAAFRTRRFRGVVSTLRLAYLG